MQICCVSASASMAPSRSIDSSRPSAALVMASANDGPRASRSASARVAPASSPHKLEPAARAARKQLADDGIHVAARAEGAAGSRDDQRTHGLAIAERAQGGRKLGVNLERQRVEPLGPIERDGSYAGRGIL